MIAAKKVAPREAFESLLESSREALLTTLAIGRSLSNEEFETAVLNAMKLRAQGTPFDGQIEKTRENAFPDIVVSGYYGVEVKQTKKDSFATTGNSIFEQARHDSVADIYIMMAKTGGTVDVRWKPYEVCIDKILITHSPRYGINLNDDAVPVFQKMGISYNDFRELPVDERMRHVRKLYNSKDKRTGRKLWWMVNKPVPEYRLYSDLDKEERNILCAAMMFVCPEMFGASLKKYNGTTIYALSEGYIIPNVRDLFSAGGQVWINGQKYPKMFGTAHHLANLIRETCRTIDTEMLANFWHENVPTNEEKRWHTWIQKVDAVAGPYRLSDVIH